MNFKNKYIKYKIKYINLKKQVGGGLNIENTKKVNKILKKLSLCKEDTLANIVTECRISLLNLIRVSKYLKEINKKIENNKNLDNESKNKTNFELKMLTDLLDDFTNKISNKIQKGGINLKNLFITALSLTSSLISYNDSITNINNGLQQIPTTYSTALSNIPSSNSINQYNNNTNNIFSHQDIDLFKNYVTENEAIEKAVKITHRDNKEILKIKDRTFISDIDDKILYSTNTKKIQNLRGNELRTIWDKRIKDLKKHNDFCKSSGEPCGKNLGIPRKFMPQIEQKGPLVSLIRNKSNKNVELNDIYNDIIEEIDIDDLIAIQKEVWRGMITSESPESIFDSEKGETKNKKFEGIVPALIKIARETVDSNKFHEKVEETINKNPILIIETENEFYGSKKFVLDGHHRFQSFREFNRIADKSGSFDYKLKKIPGTVIKLPSDIDPLDVIQLALDAGYRNKQLSGLVSHVKSIESPIDNQ